MSARRAGARKGTSATADDVANGSKQSKRSWPIRRVTRKPDKAAHTHNSDARRSVRLGDNRTQDHFPDLTDVQGELHDARSLFAIATLALEGVDHGPCRGDLNVTCAPDDITTLLALAVARLDAAIAALDTALSAQLERGAS